MRCGSLVTLVLVVIAGGIGFGIYMGNAGGYDVPEAFDSELAAPAASAPFPIQPADAELASFTDAVASDVQRVWKRLFAKAGKPYKLAKVVRYSGIIDTACGPTPESIGPFYCPADHGIYLDMSFFRDMRKGMGDQGNAGWAYVIGHEFGHHVQQITGVLPRVQELRKQDPSDGAGDSRVAVRAELQADCYSGVWAHSALQRGQFQESEIQGALSAASSIGDDRLQRLSGRPVIDPDLFTHGTSQQRTGWFLTGYRSGSPAACDSFSPSDV